MKRSALTASAVVLAAIVLLTLTSWGQTVPQNLRHVFVTNFPHPMHVEGKVSVVGAVRLSEMRSFDQVVVPPVQPTDTTRLVEAGMLVTDGFPSVVLSLHGVVKGMVHKPGTVGAILIPDEQTIQEAFNEQGLMHFTLDVTAAGVSSQTPYFASNQPTFTVGFTEYKVLLYNTTDKTVTVDLFAYLTNSG